LAVLPQLTWHFDEPFADTRAIAGFYVSQLSKSEVTVVLTGDGGDEAFGGHARYASVGSPRDRLAALVARLRGHHPSARYARTMARFSAEQKLRLYTDGLRGELESVDSAALVAGVYDSSRARDQLSRLIDVDVNTYLPGDVLTRVDVTTMANSMEARNPFLDHHMLEWAAGLPAALKVRRGHTKYLLKKAVAPWLPAQTLTRPATGFAIPLADWLRGELRDLVHDTLTDATARDRGLFRPEAVAGLLRRHEGGRDHSDQIWTLLQFELWHRTFMDRPLPTARLVPAAAPAPEAPAAA